MNINYIIHNRDIFYQANLHAWKEKDLSSTVLSYDKNFTKRFHFIE